MNYNTYQDPRAGIAFLPGTFPTNTVQNYLQEIAPLTNWSRSKVNGLYNAYKSSVLNDKIKPYTPNDPAVKQNMIDKYGYPLKEVTFFVLAVYKLVKAGKIKPYYLNFIETPGAVTQIFKKATGGLDAQIKNLKFFAVIGLIGVGLYFAWPVLTKGRKVLKKRVK